MRPLTPLVFLLLCLLPLPSTTSAVMPRRPDKDIEGDKKSVNNKSVNNKSGGGGIDGESVSSLSPTPGIQKATPPAASPPDSPGLDKKSSKNAGGSEKPKTKRRRAPVIVGSDGHSHTFGDPSDQPVTFQTVERKREMETDREARASALARAEAKAGRGELLSASVVAALRSGGPGILAGMVQVMLTMWSRTIVNYQHRYGGTFLSTLFTLLNEGGVRRLYSGLWLGLVMGPLGRFGSTAAAEGVRVALRHRSLKTQTAVASLFVGFWRLLLMPLDTCKIVLQVDGKAGFQNLLRKVRGGQFGVLFQGSLATAVASIVGHYPWWFMYRLLSDAKRGIGAMKDGAMKSALIGFVSSLVSDVVINSIKVIKTTKQAVGAKHSISYAAAIKMVLSASGYAGLFFRGLPVRIVTNGVNSVIFTVCWRGLMDLFRRRREKRELNNKKKKKKKKD